jgi:hypothetical protein
MTTSRLLFFPNLVLLAILPILSSCGRGDSTTVADTSEVPNGTPPPPPPTLGIEPPDLTSDIGESPIRLVLFAIGATISPSDVDAVRGALSIVDGAGLSLPFHTQISSEPTGSLGPGTNRTFVTLKPDSALPPGWFSINLTKIPVGWRLAGGGVWSSSTAPNSLATARLARGDAPVLRSLTVCWPEQKVELGVQFSQNVLVSTGTDAKLSVVADEVPCDMRAAQDLNTETVEFLCKGQAMPSDIQLVFDGLTSAQGTQVQVLEDSFRTSVDLNSDMFEDGAPAGECKVYHF